MLSMFLFAVAMLIYVNKRIGPSLGDPFWRTDFLSVLFSLGMGCLVSMSLGRLPQMKLTKFTVAKLGSFQGVPAKSNKTYLTARYVPGSFGQDPETRYAYYLEGNERHVVETISESEVIKVNYFKGKSKSAEVRIYISEPIDSLWSWKIVFAHREFKYEFMIPEGSLVVQ